MPQYKPDKVSFFLTEKHKKSPVQKQPDLQYQ
jgi:hypothetical protein